MNLLIRTEAASFEISDLDETLEQQIVIEEIIEKWEKNRTDIDDTEFLRNLIVSYIVKEYKK